MAKTRKGISFKGSEVVRYHIIQGIRYGVLEFLEVGTTFDIFQNIHILYLEYGVLSFSGYDVLSFIPLWSLTKSLKNPNSSIMKKLDRIMINGELIHQFQNASGEFLPFVISDHSPVVVTIPEGLKMNRRSFRFVNYIADKEEFADYVTSLKEKLINAQAEMEKDPFNTEMKAKAASFLNESLIASNDELKFICNEKGVRFDGDNVATAFVEHFKSFLGSKHDVQPLDSVEINFDKVLSKEEAEDMIGLVTDEEIKEAVFDIDSNKASGPDGYTSGFFKKAWHIVGKEVCLAIKYFFMNGKLLGEINATLIALIPKVDVSNKVSEFRPIACYNVVYKSISKILTNIIKNGLQKVRKKGARRCALKIDIQKAYDTVSSEFLGKIMLKFGFHHVMVNWIMTCVKTSKFYICVNGEAHGYFNEGKGLRQGDLISPYLFTLVMEVFSLLLSNNIQKARKIKYHHGCKELKLSNMCFDDDLLILCNGDMESVGVIKQTMDQFSSISGLFPNVGKSTIFFGSVPLSVQNEILSIMPFQVGSLPMKYLGVPLISQKLGINDCKSLVNKVAEKINCWKNKMLTYARRIQLIASVLSSMQIY
ncbi:RNA-directed DNA polymerase, eukaryota, reverse transcriptase zinc-binding domain protein [Tanacetum coccineum]